MAEDLTNRPASINPTSVLEGEKAPQNIDNNLENTTNGGVVTQTLGFKIHSPNFDNGQFVKTSIAFAQAGLSMDAIARTGQEKGYEVEKVEIDAGMLGGYRDKDWDVKELSGMTVVYQYRKAIANDRQLSAGQSQQLVPISEAIMVSSEDKKEILEGVAIVTEQQAQFNPIQPQSGQQNNLPESAGSLYLPSVNGSVLEQVEVVVDAKLSQIDQEDQQRGFNLIRNSNKR